MEGLEERVAGTHDTMSRPLRALGYLGCYAVAALVSACVCSFASAQTAEDAATESTEPVSEEKSSRAWISGSFETGIDLQFDDRDEDINLNQTLRLTIDPPGVDWLRFRGSLWMHEDLDGDERRGSVLSDINDASRSNVRARLLYLYAEFEDLWGDSVLRLGRQRILEGVAYNRIDGAYFRQNHRLWNWYAFGGVRASIYEDSSDDPAVGGGIAYRPIPKLRLALDTFYAEDNRSLNDRVIRDPITSFLGLAFPRRVDDRVRDIALGLSIAYDVTSNVNLYGQYLWRDGNGDEVRVSATGFVPRFDLTYEFSFRSQLTAAGDSVNDLTNFFRILGRFEPFYNVLAAVHKPIGEKYLLSFEAEIHDSENDDPLTANRDFERFAIIFSGEDLYKGIEVSVALERWTVPGGEGTWSLSGEVSREWEKVEASFGVDFERYEDRFVRFNPLPGQLDRLGTLLLPGVFPSFAALVPLLDTTVVETHENIYTVFSAVRLTIRENQELSTRLTFEDDDGPDSPYWRLRAEYRLRF